jgi:Ca2+-binding RTX toxin-like protein
VGAGTNHITAVSAAPVNFITDQGGNDTINVGTSTGNYTITVGKGNAVITGGSGNEMITTGPGNDTINCGSGNNTITTGPGNDIINGGSGNDTIITGAGNDTINGGGGVNNITVGIGRHNFVFTSTTGVDDITGFTVIHDKLTFNHLDFPSLKSLTAANLEIGSAAVTAAQHLIYNPTTGEVSYAAQGSAGPAVEVALIGVHLNLSIANFAVI